MATEIQWYVDPDATGLADGTSWTDAYTSLSAWSLAEAKDLVAADEKFTVNCRSSAGGDDTTAAQFGAGWTTDATRYPEIIGTDFPADGILDDSKYFLNVVDPGGTLAAMNLPINWELRKIQIRLTSTDASNRSILSGSTATVDSCILEAVVSGTGYIWGIVSVGTLTVFNTIVSGCDTHASSQGTRDQGLALNLYNCTIWGCTTGVQELGTTVCVNCIVANNADDFAGAVSIDYCASDDGDGTNAVAPAGGDWDNEFTDKDNSDFSLVRTGNCSNGGTDDPASGAYDDDIKDVLRATPWSIGAHGAVVGGRQLVNKGGGINSILLVGRVG